MLVGPSNRKRKNQRTYVRHMKKRGDTCDFCEFTPASEQTVGSTKDLWIIKNLFSYDIWDDTPVIDHLLIVPKRHVVGLHEFNAEELEQFFTVLKKYEKDGYSIYARAPADANKSVVHQHTHLIKLGGQHNTFKLYVKKPHVLIYK